VLRPLRPPDERNSLAFGAPFSSDDDLHAASTSLIERPRLTLKS
jgi:hypothetical protein